MIIITFLSYKPQLMGCIPVAFKDAFQPRSQDPRLGCASVKGSSKDLCLEGERLFTSRSLSHDGKVACSDCHQAKHNFGNAHAFATVRQTKSRGPRVRTLLDVSLKQTELFWNGRARSLKGAIFWPLYSDNEVAASESTLESHGGADHITTALASYLSTLKSGPAPWDEYLRGNCAALSESELQGFQLFTSLNCHSCHKGSEFNSQEPVFLTYFNLPEEVFNDSEAIYGSDWPLHGPIKTKVKISSIPQPLRNLNHNKFFGRFASFTELKPYIHHHLGQLNQQTSMDINPLVSFLQSSLRSYPLDYSKSKTTKKKDSH